MSLIETLEKQFSLVAWILALAFVIQKIEPLVNFLKWVYRKLRPQPKMEDDELKKMINELIDDVSRFMLDRKNRDPVYRSRRMRVTDDEEEKRRRWDEYGQEMTRYSNETMSEFTSRFIQRIALIREELAQRGIEDAELERSFELRVNQFAIQTIIAKLAEMSAKI